MEITPDILTAGAVAVIAGLVQIIKPFIKDERFWPLAAVGLGVVWRMAVAASQGPLGGQQGLEVALTGIVTGLAASGLYSAAKTVQENHN